MLDVRWQDGQAGRVDDPYRFPPVLGDMDIWLMGEGTHLRPFEVLGAQQRTLLGVAGTSFAVWAPNASAVSVIGDFNGWQHGKTPLSQRAQSGIWEGFVPGAHRGQRYVYHLVSHHNDYRIDKADPFAVHAQTPPERASVIMFSASQAREFSLLRFQASSLGLRSSSIVLVVQSGKVSSILAHSSSTLASSSDRSTVPFFISALPSSSAAPVLGSP